MATVPPSVARVTRMVLSSMLSFVPREDSSESGLCFMVVVNLTVELAGVTDVQLQISKRQIDHHWHPMVAIGAVIGDAK